jgi:hypothetical protein
MKQTQTNYQSAELRLPPAVVCGLNGGHQIKILPSICQFSPNAKGCASDNAEIRAALLQQLEQWNGRDAQTDDTNLAVHYNMLQLWQIHTLHVSNPLGCLSTKTELHAFWQMMDWESIQINWT